MELNDFSLQKSLKIMKPKRNNVQSRMKNAEKRQPTEYVMSVQFKNKHGD